jgi:hypothetical protein
MQLAPTGTPPAGRVGAAHALDNGGRRVLMLGGVSGGVHVSDAATLSLDGTPAWTLLSPAGTSPSGRRHCSAVYDPLRLRLVVYGGTDENGVTQGDVWELFAGTTPAWVALAPSGSAPAERAGHVSVLDAANDRMIVFGGSRDVSGYGELRLRDVAMLSWNNEVVGVAPVPRGPVAFALGTIAPQPVRRGASLRVELAIPAGAASGAFVQILDVRGRVLAHRPLTTDERASGAVRVSTDAALAPGVYLLRATVGEQHASRAINVID